MDFSRWKLLVKYALFPTFRGVYSHTDHYIIVAKVWGRLSVRRRATQKFVLERFNLNNQNDVLANEKYEIKIAEVFCSFQHMDDNMDMNMISTSTTEM